MLILVASVLIGCPPVAQVGGYGYGGGYAQPTYYAQQYYAPTYQAQAYQAPQAYLQADADYFAAKVAEYARKKVLEQQAAQQQLELLNRVDKLEKLAVQPPPQPFQAPQPSPQYQATPQYQAPPVPSKQAPQFEAPPPPLAQPPVPSKSSYGPAGGPTLPPTTPATPDFNGFQSYAPSPPVSLVASLGKCAACHTGAGSKNGFVIFDSPGVLADLGIDQRMKMIYAINGVKGFLPMPPGSRPDPAIVASLMQSIQADISAVASNNIGGTRR
jgi:hypothetical protein